jgi:NAD(P)-dependent dehydrogenase (short-subunit alcohol dehydrogenase family)
MTDIAHKTAFITGGAGGIGYAIAEALGKRGANVMIGDLDAGAIEAAVTKLSGLGIKARGVVCDVAKESDMRAAAQATVEAFDKVHIIVNNAGVGLNGKPGKMTCATGAGSWTSI